MVRIAALEMPTLPTTRLSVNPDQSAEECEHCCPWWLPLHMGRRRACDVPLTFEEWIVYRLHITHHQGLGLVA